MHLLLSENGEEIFASEEDRKTSQILNTSSKNYYGKRFDNRAVRMFG